MSTINIDFAGENRIFSALYNQVQSSIKENTVSSLKQADESYRLSLDLQFQTGRIMQEGRDGLLKAWSKDYKRMLKTAKPDDDEEEFRLN